MMGNCHGGSDGRLVTDSSTNCSPRFSLSSQSVSLREMSAAFARVLRAPPLALSRPCGREEEEEEEEREGAERPQRPAEVVPPRWPRASRARCDSRCTVCSIPAVSWGHKGCVPSQSPVRWSHVQVVKCLLLSFVVNAPVFLHPRVDHIPVL